MRKLGLAFIVSMVGLAQVACSSDGDNDQAKAMMQYCMFAKDHCSQQAASFLNGPSVQALQARSSAIPGVQAPPNLTGSSTGTPFVLGQIRQAVDSSQDANVRTQAANISSQLNQLAAQNPDQLQAVVKGVAQSMSRSPASFDTIPQLAAPPPASGAAAARQTASVSGGQSVSGEAMR